MNSPNFNKSIYPNNYLFYEDVKQFVKVYFVKGFYSKDSSKFPFTKVSGFTLHDFTVLQLFAVAQKSSSTTESDMMETDNDGGAAGAAAAAVPKDDQVS